MKIDFHSHIMPELDHGSRSLENSIAQIEIMKKSKVDAVVSTSHFYPHRHSVPDFLAARARSAAMLTSAIDGEAPKITLGAEVLVCENIDKMPGIDKLCIEGTRYILLELPFAGWKHEHFAAIEALRDEHGLIPILAHIDRYPKENIDRVFSRELLFQLNAPSILSFFHGKKYMTYADMEEAVALGSDIHGTDGYDEFDRACKKLAGKGVYDRLMARSEAVLKDAKFIN